MVCLVLLTKQDGVCDKVVFDGHYRWLDPAITQHNDNVILSFSLVIENALTATMKRQIRLNEEMLYDVVMKYQGEVTKNKNDKLLILWLSVLCKLTNSEPACESLMANLYLALDALIREHYYNEPVFEKFYVVTT
jgi:ribosomal protein S6